MPDHMGGEEYRLTIRAMKSDVPPIVRLRRCLKTLGRVFEFQCLSVVDATPQLPGGPPSPAAHAPGEPACGTQEGEHGT